MSSQENDRQRRLTPVRSARPPAALDVQESAAPLSAVEEESRQGTPSRHEPPPPKAGPPASRRASPERLQLVVAIFAFGYLVISVVWALSNPAPSGTDEAAHYIKALATGQGELVGPHALFPFRDPNTPGVMYYWDQSTLAFRVPAQQAPAATFQCDAGGASTVAATCVSGTRCGRWAAPCSGSPPVTGNVVLVTYVGDYVPTMYVVPGVMALLGNNDVNGLRFARLGAILFALVMVALAAMLLIDGKAPALSLVGLFVSVTPTAVYMSSVLNPNGGEIAASICFAAAMIRIWRDQGSPATWVWLTAGVSGALLGASRAYGPLWIVAAALPAVVLIGIRPSVIALRRAGSPALLAVGLVIAGVVADLVWWQVVGVPKSRTSLLTFPRYIGLYLNALPHIFEQEIGLFGWMDISLGSVGYIIWSVITVAVVTPALLVGSARQRTVLIALIAGDLIVTILLSAVMRVAWDFPGAHQVGRYFLPWTVVITLFSGEILRRNSARLGTLLRLGLPIAVGVGAGLCQGIAIWMAARRFAVGVNGRLFFITDSRWSPHFGWVPWLALAGLGCLTIIFASCMAVRTFPVPEATPFGGTAGHGRWRTPAGG